jgi:decaprenylphospho-beta-D-ribofuranose 2-oxidase
VTDGPPTGHDELVHGWGGTAPTRARLVAPESLDALDLACEDHAPRGMVARGLGRSYGDAAQNAGGTVVTTTQLDRLTHLDPATGTVRVEAGLSLDALMRAVVPQGWFPIVVPGTSKVTIGGAIASDVHGKYRHGSFCDTVERLSLHTPHDGVVELAPDAPDADARSLYWATAGGMGLTGTVREATLRLHPIETSSMWVRTERCVDLDACMTAMLDDSYAHRYSVAWIDCLAGGRSLGRSILERGDHAPRSMLSAAQQADPLHFGPRRSVSAPPFVPGGLLNSLSVRAFNELWFRRSPRHPHEGLHSISAFFHPLDMVDGFGRIYGPRGFVQYQFVVPYGEEAVVRRVLERLAATRCASFLAVLKRFESGNDGLLSFPMPGWTLALDIPAARSGLAELLDEFDRAVLDAGGRVYLAKDARVAPEAFERMYPRLDDWRAVRRRVDPEQVLRSDLARRLGL